MCQTEQNTEITLHPFEAAGLGLAPFRCVGVRENVYSAAPGHRQPGGTCQYCGQGIMYECMIQSKDGKVFKVGIDCVRKCDRDDNRALTVAEREMAKINKAKKDAKRQAKWEEANRKREAELDRQRSVNGGLTDYEVEQAKRKAAEDAQREAVCKANEWLVKVIQKCPGDFARSMVERLESKPVASLSPRMIQVLCEMYAKATGGRKNSKGYAKAAQFFCAQAGVDPEFA